MILLKVVYRAIKLCKKADIIEEYIKTFER